MNRRILVTALVVAAVLAGVIFIVKKNQPAVGITSSSADKTKGAETAPVHIIEYSDFQCPACSRVQPLLATLMQEYPGKIKVTFRHYPLPMHRWAGVAHQAAECANVQGKFWEFHDRVYMAQPLWAAADNAPEFLIAYARDSGVDLEKFGACLSDSKITQKILAERAKGSELKLSSTPTFFINGERVVGQVELDGKGRQIIRKILGLPEISAKPAVSNLPPASGTSEPFKN